MIRVLLAAVLLLSAGRVQNPPVTPVLATTAGLSPSLVQVGSGSFTLTLKGSGFGIGSTVRLGSTNLATTYSDSNTLTAIVPASLLKVIGPQAATVVNAPGGTSNKIDLMVTHRGDASGSGTLNIGDALVLARSVGGLVEPRIPVGLGDLNLNDSVNIGDALTAALFAGGLKTNFDTPTIASTNVSGNSLSLTGAGFSSTADNNVVVFAKAGGGVTSALATEVAAASPGNKTLTLMIPGNAVSGPVFVKRRDLGLPGQPFVITVPGTAIPLYISRASLSAGSITLTGSGFHTTAGANIVTFSSASGTVAATPIAASATSLTVTLPLGAVSGFVSVSVGSRTSNRKATLIPGTPTPLFLAHVYYSDAPGEPILIEGIGFNAANPADNQVLFNDTPGVVVAAGRTELIVLVPAGATTATLKVKTGAGSLTSNVWSYTAGNDLPPPPTVTSIVPASGLVASAINVAITGRDFVSGQTTVTVIGTGVTATQVAVMSPTLIGATLNVDSTATPGNVVIRVATSGGAATGLTFTVTPRINTLIFVDPVTTTITKELTIKEGSSLQAQLRSYDGAGALRQGLAVTWSGSNSEVASINASGNIQGNKAGFATLTANAGGTVVTATLSVVQMNSGAEAADATGIAQDASNQIYLALGPDHTIRTTAGATQPVSVYAGIAQTPGLKNDLRLLSLFETPAFIAVDSGDGTLYVSDSANHVIRRVRPGASGRVETLAGTGAAGSQDGPLASASFNNPQGIAMDDSRNLWVVDSGNHTIRKIDLGLGTVSTVAGLAGASGSSDGMGPQARFNAPLGIAVETQAAAPQLDLLRFGSAVPVTRLIVADAGNGLVRRLRTSGEVETLPVRFDKPTGVATDPVGNIYVTEPNDGVKTILRSGSVVTTNPSNTVKNPKGVALTASGKVIVTDRDRSIAEIRYGRPQIDSVDLPPVNGARVTLRGRNFAPESIVIASGVFVTNTTVRDTETIELTVPSLPGGSAKTLTVLNRGGLHGIVAGDLTLREIDTPHTLNGGLLVSANVKLTFEPGTVLRVEPDEAIVVGGLFEARGTSSAPIRFTSRTPTPQPGDWAGIVFTDASVDAQFNINGSYVSGSILENVIIEYAGAGLGAAALRLADAAPFVNFNTIRHNRGAGIHAALDPTRISSPRIANNTIVNNTRGVFATTPGNTILLEGNIISDNTEDGVVFNETIAGTPGLATVINNMVAGNGGDGIRAITNGTVAILNNRIARNRRGIGITDNRNGGLTITGNLIQNNQPLGGMFVNPDGAINISRNTVIFNAHEATGGGLSMSGLPGSGVATVTNNIFAGNTAALDGGGIYLDWVETRPSGQATIANNVFAGNVAPRNAAARLGLLQNYDYFFTANTVTQNRSTTTGTAAVSANFRATLTARQNNWFNNAATYTLQNATANTAPALSAVSNWWGTASEPAIQAAIHDFSDDSTRGVVAYAAALPVASVSAPISPPSNFQVAMVNRTLSLQWSANPEADLVGYKIYYSTTGYPYTSTIDVGNVTSFVLTGLPTGPYFVTVTAYDGSRDNQADQIDGNESWFASEVATEVLPPVPTLSRVDPSSAIQGTSVNVTFTGSNFIAGATTVAISGTPPGVTVGPVAVISPTTLSVTLSIGAQATTGVRILTASTRGGTSNGVTFTLFGIPTLTSINPAAGLAGTAVPVTIIGTHFLQGATTLLTSGVDMTIGAVSVINPTTLTAVLTIPGGATNGLRNLRVVTAGGTSNSLKFALGLGIEPISGLPGTTVPITLIGAGFIAGSTTVTVSGTGITIGLASVTNATTLTSTLTIAGNAPAGARSVTVRTGTSSSSVSFWVPAAQVTDSSIRVPPDYYSFLPPAIGNTYVDPIFGSTIKRMSDATISPDAAYGAGFLPFISTEYSTMSPFNMDNSKILALHFSYFGLYHGIFDTAGNFIKNLPFPVSASTEPRWSRTNPNHLYFINGNQLKKLDVSTDIISVIHTFTEYTSVTGNGESDISFDGDHFVLIGNNRFVFVYRISSDVVGPAFDTGGRPFDSLYITPDNNVTITWYDRGSARYNGIELFDRNMNFLRQVTRAGGHMDVARDTDGEEVLVWTNSNDALATCPNSVVKIRLRTGQQTCLLTLDIGLALHISGTDNSGWFIMETYAPGDPNPSSSNWKPYTNEILQVKLDGTQVRRLAHHRSRPFNDYNYEPRASTSRDGSRIVFTSNYSLQSILGYNPLYSDVYLIVLPQQ